MPLARPEPLAHMHHRPASSLGAQKFPFAASSFFPGLSTLSGPLTPFYTNISTLPLPPVNHRQLEIRRQLCKISELDPGGNDCITQGPLPCTLGIGVPCVHGRQTALLVNIGVSRAVRRP